MENLENGGYFRTWKNCKVTVAEGYQSVMVDFHTHDFYEISLILSGNVRSLLKDRAVDGAESRLLLTAPHTPHLVYLTAPGLYSRINLSFSREFLENYVPEWGRLSKVFGRDGSILLLRSEQRELCREKLIAIRDEENLFRQRLLILELLSYVAEFDPSGESGESDTAPGYIMEALAYVDSHYAERIVAAGLADEVELQVAYAIGVARPVSVFVNTYGTGKLTDSQIADIVLKEFDLRPYSIIQTLKLRTPVYAQTASYGHFGKAGLSWEKTDKINDLKKYL